MVPCCDQTPGRKSRVNIPTVSSHIGDGASILAFLGCRQSASQSQCASVSVLYLTLPHMQHHMRPVAVLLVEDG